MPPDKDHPLSKRRDPYSGKTVRQRLDNGRSICGRLLVGQCQAHTKRTGKRCRNSTSHDYRYCWVHLMRRFQLMVAPSRIPGANMGLFAVDEKALRTLGYDRDMRPVRDGSVLLWRPDDIIGDDHLAFEGERISYDELMARYPDENGGDYVLGWGDNEDYFIDELFARTILSYSNDAVNMNDTQFRRNYHKGDKVKVTMPKWPYLLNAAGVAYGNGTQLQAIGPIRHGDEIFWSYAGSKKPSRNADGSWRMTDDGEFGDLYWSAKNHH